MRTAIVTIHGAGKHMSDFWEQDARRLQAVLNAPVDMRACWYADITNLGAGVLGNDFGADLAAAQAFQKRLEADMVAQYAEVGDLGVVADLTTATDLARDVTLYLWSGDVQTRTQTRLIEVLRKASDESDRTLLISHSLGTVVAFDLLRDYAANFNVHTWFTLGSPLAKLRKLDARRALVGDIATSVRYWYNLYDTSDPVANPIGPQFPAYRIRDVFVKNSDNAIKAHDYWSNPDTAAMIVDAMRSP